MEIFKLSKERMILFLHLQLTLIEHLLMSLIRSIWIFQKTPLENYKDCLKGFYLSSQLYCTPHQRVKEESGAIVLLSLIHRT